MHAHATRCIMPAHYAKSYICKHSHCNVASCPREWETAYIVFRTLLRLRPLSTSMLALKLSLPLLGVLNLSRM
jgi:hypothetical protein